jgi:outer membrane protein OmpA-like peptidoglycan-associated protein
VSVVDFPAAQITWDCNTLAVLPDNGDVGFVPDQAVFRNPAAASTVLKRFGAFLRDNPTAHVQIDGFVAHYGGAGDLSQRRADAVKNQLTSQGLRNTITATGKGWGPFPSPQAPPDKKYDQLNRRVTIEVSCK